MKRAVDYSYEQNLDKVERIAIDVALRLRDEDPTRLFDETRNLCEYHPMRAAQLLMCLAAYLDPNTPKSVLDNRVYAITEDRREAMRRQFTPLEEAS